MISRHNQHWNWLKNLITRHVSKIGKERRLKIEKLGSTVIVKVRYWIASQHLDFLLVDMKDISERSSLEMKNRFTTIIRVLENRESIKKKFSSQT